MKVHYPKLYNMAHLPALYFYCFQLKDLTIIFINKTIVGFFRLRFYIVKNLKDTPIHIGQIHSFHLYV